MAENLTRILEEINRNFEIIASHYELEQTAEGHVIRAAEGAEIADTRIYLENFSAFKELIEKIPADQRGILSDEHFAVPIMSAKKALICFEYHAGKASNEKEKDAIESYYNTLKLVMDNAKIIHSKLISFVLPESYKEFFSNEPQHPGLMQIVNVLMNICQEYIKQISEAAREKEKEKEKEEEEEEQPFAEGPFEYIAYVFFDSKMKQMVEDMEPDKKKWVDTGRCAQISQGSADRGKDFYFPPKNVTGLYAHDFISSRGKWKGTPVSFIGLGVKIPKAASVWGTQRYVWAYRDADWLPQDLRIMIKRAAFKLKLIENMGQFREEVEKIRMLVESLEGSADSKADAANELLGGAVTRKTISEIKDFHTALRDIVAGHPQARAELGASDYNQAEFEGAVKWFITDINDLHRYLLELIEQIRAERNMKFIIDQKTSKVGRDAVRQAEDAFNNKFKELRRRLGAIHNSNRALLKIYDKHKDELQ